MKDCLTIKPHYEKIILYDQYSCQIFINDYK